MTDYVVEDRALANKGPGRELAVFKTIFFDFGGTLIDCGPMDRCCYTRMIREVLRTYGRPEDPEQHLHLAWTLKDEAYRERNEKFGLTASNLKHSQESDEFMIRTLARRLVEEIAQDAAPEDVVDRVYDGFLKGITDVDCLFPEARDTLVALSRDYTLGIISDQMIEPVTDFLRHVGLIELFDVVAISAAVGHTKPHPSMFTGALEKTGTEPAEAMMVGDFLEQDIAGANAMGMVSVWINRSQAPPSDAIKPDYVIDDLSKLIDIASALRQQQN